MVQSLAVFGGNASSTDTVLYGLPGAYYQTLAIDPDPGLKLHHTELDFFMQDSVKLTSNFTANLGLRFSKNGLPASQDQRFKNDFDPTKFQEQLNRTKSACSDPYCLSIVNYLASAFPPDFQKVFGASPFAVDPRVGFAWDPGRIGKSVVRGGWGLYTGLFPAIILNESRSAFPRFLPLNLAMPSQYLSAPYLKPGTLNVVAREFSGDPVQVLASVLSDAFAKERELQGGNGTLQAVQPGPGLKNPRSMQMHVSLEKQIGQNTTLSVAWVGSMSRHLLRVTKPGAIGPYSTGFFFTGFSTFSTYLYPAVSNTLLESTANANYQSLQAQIRGRNAKDGLSFGAAFTYSHAIDDASDFFDTSGSFALPQDSSQRSERGSSSYDARLRAAAYFLWEPRWGSQNWLLRRWQVSGILTAQTGQPFTINSARDVNGDGVLTDRLDATEGLSIDANGDRRVRLRLPPQVDPGQLLADSRRGLDGISCLNGLEAYLAGPFSGTGTVPPPGRVFRNLCDGAVGRNTFRASGISSVDLSAGREFYISEGKSLILRLEGFNVLNRPNFSIPVRILEAPGFGSSVSTSTPNRILQFCLKLRF